MPMQLISMSNGKVELFFLSLKKIKDKEKRIPKAGCPYTKSKLNQGEKRTR